MASKYGLKEENTKEELLDKILEKDKYLRLGHYLILNRNDWNDGPNFAENGLYSFSVETEEDKLIYAEISSLIDNWGGDGRCFRDCHWSYDHLFTKVDTDLYKDFEKVSGWIDANY